MFAGFVLTDDTIVKSLGFALAVGVAVDAFLVRMTIVPAVMSLLGRAAWWLPGWLDRLLPNIDVEGEQLAHRLAAEQEPVEAPPGAQSPAAETAEPEADHVCGGGCADRVEPTRELDLVGA